MGDGLLHRFTRPLRRGSISVDMGFPRPVPLQPVIDDMCQRVLARQVEVEGFRASGRAEDAPYTAAPDEAASPNPSGQGALRILSAAHRCPWGPPVVGWWSVGLLAFPSEIGAGPQSLQHLGKAGAVIG